MKKITFLGIESEKDQFIKRLQEVGVVHLIYPQEAVDPSDLVRELQRVVEAKKFLAKKGSAGNPEKILDSKAICAQREALGQEEARINGEINVLKKDRALIEPWGDFSLEDLELLLNSGLQVYFFRVPKKVFYMLPISDLYCYMAQEKAGEICFTVLSSEPVQLGVPEEKLPSKSLSEIDREIALKQADLLRIEKEYVALAEHLKALKDAEAGLTDIVEYQRALLNIRPELEDRIFVVQCWSPMAEEELFQKIGTSFTFYHYSEDPRDDDRVPVLMKNHPTFNSGEDLVKVYSYPGYKDVDPSPFVLYCFAVFFGMIIGDAGYGLTCLAITIFLHHKFRSDSPFAVRFFRMMYLLSFAVIAFGVLSGSYFGIVLHSNNPLLKLCVLNMTTIKGQNQVMIVSMVMGLVHLSMSHAIKFYNTRNYASIGWIITGWSGYFLINSTMGKGTDNPVAMYCMIGGLAIILFFSSASSNIFLRIALGLNAVLGIVQFFSDVLSYLRLFALGVATVYMAQTFNMLADQIVQGVPWVGFILAGLVALVGHTVNLALGVMGGVVHGLRLNFLEWYRWSFEGDGLPYKPFQQISKQE